MAPPYFDITLPHPDRDGDLVAGNVVLSGEGPVELLRPSGLRIRRAPACVEPAHTDAGTRAVVLVAPDAKSAVRRAEAVRTWAHESLLPLIALVERPVDVEDPKLWERTLTCAPVGDADHVARLVTDLGRRRDGLPTNDDADRTWHLRHQLRHGPLSRCGHGLDAFVAGDTAFVGGLIHPNATKATITDSLCVPPRTRLNTDALRTCAARP